MKFRDTSAKLSDLDLPDVSAYPHELPYEARYWAKKDGSKMRVRDMQDSHVANCIRMIKEKANETFVQKRNQQRADLYYIVGKFPFYVGMVREAQRRLGIVESQATSPDNNDPYVSWSPSYTTSTGLSLTALPVPPSYKDLKLGIEFTPKPKKQKKKSQQVAPDIRARKFRFE